MGGEGEKSIYIRGNWHFFLGWGGVEGTKKEHSVKNSQKKSEKWFFLVSFEPRNSFLPFSLF